MIDMHPFLALARFAVNKDRAYFATARDDSVKTRVDTVDNEFIWLRYVTW